MGHSKKALLLVVLVSLLTGCGNAFTSSKIKKQVKKYENEQSFVLTSVFFSGQLSYEILETGLMTSFAQYEDQLSEFQTFASAYDASKDQLKDGYHLILVKLRVTNLNAVPHPDMFPSWDDLPEDCFRADIIYLANLEQVSDMPDYWDEVIYFDSPYDSKIHSMAYRLPQGDSMDYTVGFLVKAESMDQLYLTDHANGADGFFIHVNMS